MIWAGKQKYATETDYTRVCQVLLVATVLLTIAVLWNRRLSHEIGLGVATEEVLCLAHQRQLLHRKQNPLGVIEWNKNFESVYWNKAAERICAYSKEQALGRRAVGAQHSMRPSRSG